MKRISKTLIASAEAILLHNSMKKTPIRIEILSYLLSLSHAVSKQDIEANLNDHDRITVYRTVKSFLEKEVIHRVMGFTGEVKYALNETHEHHATDSHEHDKSHVHFHCIKCEETICLPVKVPEIKMPRNYKVVNTNYSVEGVCESCKG
jgi:Fur family transcriptional regulator, ferric uptake regulator